MIAPDPQPTKIKFQADADFNEDIIAGVMRRVAQVDFQTANDADLCGVSDENVLDFAAREDRVLVTHDRRTMPTHFAHFIMQRESPGVLIVAQNVEVIVAIEELLLIWDVSTPSEWVNRISSLPL